MPMSDPCGCGFHGATRREVLRWGAAAAGITALGPFRGLLPTAHGSPIPVKRLIVLNMFGGNDTLNMFVPVGLSSYYARRPNIAIPSGSALSLAGPAATNNYKLHPSMPKIASLWNEGSVAAVNRVGYPDENLSHFTSQDIFSLGVRNSFGPLGIPQSGWIARFADLYAPTPMGAVALGVGRPLDFQGGNTPPFLANDLPNFKFVGGTSAAQLHRVQKAKTVLANFTGTANVGEAKKSQQLAYDLVDQIQASITGYSTYAAGSGVTYSGGYISRRLREVATLIQGGFETRIFFTGFGGFDTHSAQGSSTGAMATLLQNLDDAVGSLAADLKVMGVWDDTVIAVITEFGRRSYENGSAGTDHGHAFCELLVGGAVKGGVYGPDLVNGDINAEYPSYAVDFRSIYMEALANHLGADPAPVFPEPLEKTVNLGIL
jgi:uncharacterized protein (DUF1501 family)